MADSTDRDILNALEETASLPPIHRLPNWSRFEADRVVPAANALLDEDPATSRSLLEQANRTAKSGMAASRRALDNLRARPLQELGLLGAIKQLARDSAEKHQLLIEWNDTTWERWTR